MILRRLTIASALSLVAAQAHPGHEPFSEGTKHFVSSPNHFLPALIFATTVFFAAQFLQRRGERLFVRIISIMILAFSLF
jgi:hypothetical protein